LTLASHIPWWIDLLLVPISYVGMHLWYGALSAQIHAQQITQGSSLAREKTPSAEMNYAVQHGLHQGFLYVGMIFTIVFQYLLPIIFLIGAIVSWIRYHQYRKNP